jgi:L-ascorbate metabolism protein UlaG (beta-lactamase superfamily)
MPPKSCYEVPRSGKVPRSGIQSAKRELGGTFETKPKSLHTWDKNPMEIMYIANDGFLIKASNKKILIDALFGKFESDWCYVPTGEIIEKMETGTEPFDQIDVILISHSHIDHFNAEIVLNHLESNEAGILICPRQVMQELEKDKRYEKLSARVKEITPAYEIGCQSVDVKGMEIKVWRLAHSSYYIESEETRQKYNKHENVQNLGFTIEIDHKKIFHGGDWAYDDAGRNTNPLEEEKNYLAFLGIGAYLRLYGPDGRIIDESKKPENIVLMHIPPAINIEELTEEEKKTISATTVFKSPMEIKRFGN